MNDRKPHFSYSQIAMYQRCSMQYMFRYVEGIRRPPSGAMTLGSAVDEAESGNYLQKMESREDLPEAEVVEMYAAEFEDRRDDTDWKADDPDKFKDQGVGLMKIYHGEVAPEVQPLSVQEFMTVPLPDFPRDFVAVPDWIDEDGVIGDIKTTVKSPAAGALDRALQPTACALAYRSLHGKEETGFRYDYAVRLKTPKIVTQRTTRTDLDLSAFLALLGRFQACVDAGAYMPTDPSSWTCSQRWCGYWNICEGGGKRVERKVFIPEEVA